MCDRAVYGSLSSSLVFAGLVLALPLYSTLSDKYGRKKVIFINGILSAVCALIAAFAVDYWMFAVFRFLFGFFLGKSTKEICCCFQVKAGINNREILIVNSLAVWKKMTKEIMSAPPSLIYETGDPLKWRENTMSTGFIVSLSAAIMDQKTLRSNSVRRNPEVAIQMKPLTLTIHHRESAVKKVAFVLGPPLTLTIHPKHSLFYFVMFCLIWTENHSSKSQRCVF